MYYFAGGITIVWGILLYFVIPPDPVRVKGFNDRERYILVARLRSNNSGVRNTHFKASQAVELLLDVKFWLMFSIACLSMIANVSLLTGGVDGQRAEADARTGPDLDVHADHNLWLWLLGSECSFADDSGRGVCGHHDAHLPLLGVPVQERASVALCRRTNLDHSGGVDPLARSVIRAGRAAVCSLHTAVDRRRIRGFDGPVPCKHGRLHQAHAIVFRLVHRILPW